MIVMRSVANTQGLIDILVNDRIFILVFEFYFFCYNLIIELIKIFQKSDFVIFRLDN